jgi:hypothetical protein
VQELHQSVNGRFSSLFRRWLFPNKIRRFGSFRFPPLAWHIACDVERRLTRTTIKLTQQIIMSDSNNLMTMNTTATPPAAPACACSKPATNNPAPAPTAPAQGTRPVTPKSARRQARKQN